PQPCKPWPVARDNQSTGGSSMTVRPADSAAPTAAPRPTATPAQTNQAEHAQAPQQAPQAQAVPDTFAKKSGGGLGLPSPGDIWHGITNIFDKAKGAVSDVWGGAKDLAAKGADALTKLATEDSPGYARSVKHA